jgi:hypothetical protein
MQLHFTVLNPENRIEGYVRLGVNIAYAGKIGSCRKVAPSPGL